MDHFYFIRHGETFWNVENKICGPLTLNLHKESCNGSSERRKHADKFSADKFTREFVEYMFQISYNIHRCIAEW